jgi:hypothetical protein
LSQTIRPPARASLLTASMRPADSTFRRCNRRVSCSEEV